MVASDRRCKLQPIRSICSSSCLIDVLLYYSSRLGSTICHESVICCTRPVARVPSQVCERAESKQNAHSRQAYMNTIMQELIKLCRIPFPLQFELQPLNAMKMAGRGRPSGDRWLNHFSFLKYPLSFLEQDVSIVVVSVAHWHFIISRDQKLGLPN